MLALLDTLFLQPLLQIYSLLFALPPESFGMGGRILIFSVLINLLLMPLYHQMEQRSREGRVLRERVAAEVERMKRHFRGRERYFYIRAVYRQFNYHPISHLLGSADLFLQVLVFFTVFRFLSTQAGLDGHSFGPLADLGRPDELLGGIHLLPFVMTAINAASVHFYVSDRSRRMQAWALALLFLVLLYPSPSGLVLYWTFNNLFSLVRNIVAKLYAGREPGSLARQFAEYRRQH